MNYFPHPKTFERRPDLDALFQAFATPTDLGARIVKGLIASSIRTTGINDTHYRDDNEDIARALDGGAPTTPTEHYAEYGYFEKRSALPANFDSDWYVRTYPDVAEELRAGRLDTAERHFIGRGHLEWRLPCAAAEADHKFWISMLGG
ncbi:hypothetical protein [Shimia haliotis]|uniref:Uncharacterized protein n=1 Tax=Shimia haliotis TaxID=1280847 RepID=A0A1I4FJC0_9RHOB|nr:hypothetical protein [Shimia haliotis]SFL16926.1 hypothetical protein SAMN04488036_10627 [Shimia haliotis]